MSGDVLELVHLSDLHLGGVDLEREYRRLERLLERACAGAPHLLLGGDLVDHGNLQDLGRLVAFLSARGLLQADRLSVVPGNHDIWPFGEHDLPRQAAGYLAQRAAALLSGQASPAQARYERFCALFAKTFEGAERLASGDVYPAIKRLGPLALVLLDTCSDHGLHRSAQGRFDPGEAAQVLQALERHRGPRLLLLHHWPFQIELDGQTIIERLPPLIGRLVELAGPSRLVDPNFADLEAVQRFIREGRFDAVLCGHIHLMSDDIRDPAFDAYLGDVPVHCMGRSGAVHQEPDQAIYAYHRVTVAERVEVRTVYVEARELDG